MTKLTPTGRAQGPLEMHHHRGPAPELTAQQRKVIEDNRKTAESRRSKRPSVTAQVAGPFDLFPAPEPDPVRVETTSTPVLGTGVEASTGRNDHEL